MHNISKKNIEKKSPKGEGVVLNGSFGLMSILQHMRNDLTCKGKWGSIVRKFKKVFDYMFRT
jgi:hypothetical protein